MLLMILCRIDEMFHSAIRKINKIVHSEAEYIKYFFLELERIDVIESFLLHR